MFIQNNNEIRVKDLRKKVQGKINEVRFKIYFSKLIIEHTKNKVYCGYNCNYLTFKWQLFSTKSIIVNLMHKIVRLKMGTKEAKKATQSHENVIVAIVFV